MEISYVRELSRAEADALVVPLYENESAARGLLRELDRSLSGALAPALEAGEVRGKLFELTPWRTAGFPWKTVVFAGAGKREDADADRLRQVAGAAARYVRDRYPSVAIALRSDRHAQPVIEGFIVGDYEPDLHRSERSTSTVTSVRLVAGRDVRSDLRAAEAVAGSVNLARELVSEPPNELTPTALADRAKAELEPLGVTVQVLSGRQLERFGGLRAVAKGSEEAPVFVSLRWEPQNARKSPVLGLVGKGITFDSGGLSLKPSEGMTWMKGDMAGAAAVIGAMRAIAELKVPVAVRAAVPATENMVSGRAYRVGDVVTFYSGKTAEILNTDAEGRLILFDALAWLSEQGITHVADAATLTGAVEVALGKVAMGVLGRPDTWVNRVLGAARKAGEKAWQLPLYAEYKEQLRSDIADMKNVGGRAAGTITAAWFLAEAVPDDLPWAHLDIAGVAWDDKKPYRAAGATGSGVSAFVRLAQDLAARKDSQTRSRS